MMGKPECYSGPEVLFEEMAIDLLQARFWITSGWPTIRPELQHPAATRYAGL